ncbi:MAG: hypothetical protein ACTSV5_07550 [Promethearchaeota archaeon]
MKKISLELFKKDYWLITLISALFGFISVFFPSFSFVESDTLVSVWNWGFSFMLGSKGTGWNNAGLEIMIPGVIVNIILLVGAILILFSAVSAKRKDDNKTLFSLTGGIITIIAPILFMISMVMLSSTFWLEFFVNAGLILPYIGGFLAIVSWYSMKRA